MDENTKSTPTTGNPVIQKVFIAATAGIFLAQFAVSTWSILSQPTDSFDSNASLRALLFYLIPIAYFCFTFLVHPGRTRLQRIFESLLLTTISQLATSLLQQILFTTQVSLMGNSYGRWIWGTQAFIAIIYVFTICYLRFISKVWK